MHSVSHHHEKVKTDTPAIELIFLADACLAMAARADREWLLALAEVGS